VRRSLLLLVVLAGSVLALDVVTKRWASRTLATRPPVEVVGEFVRFTYTRNSGVAFGLGAGVKFPYYLFSIAAVAIILWLFASGRVRGNTRRVALALIFGGALGNLVDRLSTGEVVDFIEIGWNRWHWPVFNVADSAVSIGVLLFALIWSRRQDPAEAKARPGDRDDAPDPRPVAELAPRRPPFDDSYDEPLGAGAQGRGAARSLPGDGADRPVA
jgi:signal peptidase II